MNVQAWIWLCLMVVFLVLEATTVQLMSVWFALGALAALVASVLGGPLWLQIVLFFTVSVLLLALLWPMAKKHLKPKLVATNADALVGRVCTVTEAIDPRENGRVKVGDVTWSACCQQAVSAGEQVRIVKIQGAKLFVEPVKKEVEV